jgi:hypothetical protein
VTRKHDREITQSVYDRVAQICASGSADPDVAVRFSAELQPGELRKMKKFRFQLLHRWLTYHFEPCRVADIGGGKGLLAYLLQRSGWQATVIDPVAQELPDKFKDFDLNRRVKIDSAERVPHMDRPFDPGLGRYFDLLVGMHAHGSNAMVIDAAAEFGCGFILFPCCVIDEPFYPVIGVDWLESVADYAVHKGHAVYPFRINFKGQNIGLVAPGKLGIGIDVFGRNH